MLCPCLAATDGSSLWISFEQFINSLQKYNQQSDFLWPGLKVVQVRAQAMQEASDQHPSGMVSIMGRADLDIQELCVAAKEWSLSRGTQEPLACIANYLFPGGWVLGCDKSSIQYIMECGKTKVYKTSWSLLLISSCDNFQLIGYSLILNFLTFDDVFK